MEQLETTSVDISLHGKDFHCILKEKDFGDYIVYEVHSDGKYLVTISKQGDVLFNEATMSDKELMDPLLLDELVEHLRAKISSGQLK